VTLAHQMAVESTMVQAEAVDATEFSELARKYQVSGVPHTSINYGKVHLVGATPEANLLVEIQRATQS